MSWIGNSVSKGIINTLIISNNHTAAALSGVRSRYTYSVGIWTAVYDAIDTNKQNKIFSGQRECSYWMVPSGQLPKGDIVSIKRNAKLTR